MEKNSEEIDLKEILQKVFKFVVRYKFVWIATFVIGVGAGIYKYSTTKIYYEAEMIITSGILYEKNIDVYETDLQPLLSVLSALESQIDANNYDYAKDALNIEDIVFLKSLKASAFVDKALAKSDPKNIRITVEVYEKEKLVALQNKIVDFCNNNQFIKETFEKQKFFRENSIRIIDDKLKSVDSIENIMYSDDLKTSKVVFLNFTEWSNFVDLELSKFKYESLYNTESPVIVVQNLSPYPQEINDKLKKSVVFFVLVMVLGVFVAVFIEIFNFLKNE